MDAEAAELDAYYRDADPAQNWHNYARTRGELLRRVLLNLSSWVLIHAPYAEQRFQELKAARPDDMPETLRDHLANKPHEYAQLTILVTGRPDLREALLRAWTFCVESLEQPWVPWEDMAEERKALTFARLVGTERFLRDRLPSVLTGDAVLTYKEWIAREFMK